MRRDQNRLKSAITRKSVAVSVATLGVLVGVVGLETGASAFSPTHVLSHVHTDAELRRFVPGKSIDGTTVTLPTTAPMAPAPTMVAPSSTVATPTNGTLAFSTSHLLSLAHVGAEIRRFVPTMVATHKMATTPILAVPTTITPPSPVTTPASGARTTSTGPAAPTTTTTTTAPAPPATTTTTTPPATTTNGSDPIAPASLNAPTTMVLDDEFNNGALNTSLWSPNWFGNGSQSNGTSMLSSNVSVGANGLALQLNSAQSGALVSTDPSDGQPGHTGFAIAPTANKPVFVEFKATLPAATNGSIANWPALWLDGQTWPEDGEIDVMEGLSGSAAFHIHYGSGSGTAQGGSVNQLSGTHTYAVLWTTTGFTFLYDGAVVGTLSEALTSPMYLIMENSYSGGSGPTEVPATMNVRYLRVWN
jgi:hypothetical protein